MKPLVLQPWTENDSPFLENERELVKLLSKMYPHLSDGDIKYSVVIPEEILVSRGALHAPRMRADAWVESESLVVYIDTVEDYAAHLRIVHTEGIDACLRDIGYTVVHIPYFVQMSPETVLHYFGRSLDVRCDQPCGFVIGDTANEYVPAAYCSMGWNKFIEQLYSLPDNIRSEIMSSLKLHSEKFGKEMTTITFPLGLECESCPAHKARLDLRSEWESSACGLSAGPQ